ncbi:hypothetical protein LCGC14_0553230 [marine sediment metagenome]|uniref:Ferritin-like diiron domain-containing protein n=1 Tax=marine sediment metagenome TaxID=412755 RepID=A0A0F9UXK6_9ZZZZ|nr:ferritin-like domain-containing protein [Actinomycetota bacterium]
MEKQEIIEMLNKNRANELIAILQYMNHYYTVTGQDFLALRGLFRELGIVEMQHAEKIAERISVLGGQPISKTEAIQHFTDLSVNEADTMEGMINANLDYEQLAINDYTDHIKKIADNDPVTRNLLEDILGQEEEHAHDLSAWLDNKEISFKLRAVGE